MQLFKNNQSGRSMVEMLGVLAIIGVLSVGGIAGYSKAMFRHKINKQTEQLTQLINALYRYKAEWKANIGDLIPYYEALGEIPQEMLVNKSVSASGNSVIYDVFNSPVKIGTGGVYAFGHEVAISWEVSNNHSFDVCLNIANVVKQFHEHLLYTAITKTTADSSSTQFDTKYFGDKYCQNYTCISKLTMNNISKQCEYCKDSQACTYIIAFITD